MWDARCRIISVHDGDTVKVYSDRGKDDYSNEDLRLFGTFAPELSQPGGPETRDYASEWLLARSGNMGGWPFVRVMIRNKSNTHELVTLGRWVALIWTADMTECLNTAISGFVLAQGYGGGTGSKVK